MKNTHEKQEEQYVLFDTEYDKVLMIGSKNRCLRAIEEYREHFFTWTASQVALAKIIPFSREEIKEIISSTIYALVIRVEGKYGPSIYSTKNPKLVEICACLNNAMGIFGINVEFEVRLYDAKRGVSANHEEI